MILVTDLECKIGDGSGGSEIDTKKKFSLLKECIDHVKNKYPDANGATFQTSCTDSCKCFAEIDMNDWNTNDFSIKNLKSCKFEPGKHTFYTSQLIRAHPCTHKINT